MSTPFHFFSQRVVSYTYAILGSGESSVRFGRERPLSPAVNIASQFHEDGALRLSPEIPPDRDDSNNLADRHLGSVMIYPFMSGIGTLMLGLALLGYEYIVISFACGAIICHDLSKRDFETFTGKESKSYISHQR